MTEPVQNLGLAPDRFVRACGIASGYGYPVRRAFVGVVAAH